MSSNFGLNTGFIGLNKAPGSFNVSSFYSNPIKLNNNLSPLSKDTFEKTTQKSENKTELKDMPEAKKEVSKENADYILEENEDSTKWAQKNTEGGYNIYTQSSSTDSKPEAVDFLMDKSAKKQLKQQEKELKKAKKAQEKEAKKSEKAEAKKDKAEKTETENTEKEAAA